MEGQGGGGRRCERGDVEEHGDECQIFFDLGETRAAILRLVCCSAECRQLLSCLAAAQLLSCSAAQLLNSCSAAQLLICTAAQLFDGICNAENSYCFDKKLLLL